MKKKDEGPKLNEIPLTDVEFLETYNKNMPANFPKASLSLLEKFKEANSSLFKDNGAWSLDQHRKRLIDWLPQNNSQSK